MCTVARAALTWITPLWTLLELDFELVDLGSALECTEFSRSGMIMRHGHWRRI